MWCVIVRFFLKGIGDICAHEEAKGASGGWIPEGQLHARDAGQQAGPFLQGRHDGAFGGAGGEQTSDSFFVGLDWAVLDLPVRLELAAAVDEMFRYDS